MTLIELCLSGARNVFARLVSTSDTNTAESRREIWEWKGLRLASQPLHKALRPVRKKDSSYGDKGCNQRQDNQWPEVGTTITKILGNKPEGSQSDCYRIADPKFFHSNSFLKWNVPFFRAIFSQLAATASSAYQAKQEMELFA